MQYAYVRIVASKSDVTRFRMFRCEWDANKSAVHTTASGQTMNNYTSSVGFLLYKQEHHVYDLLQNCDLANVEL